MAERHEQPGVADFKELIKAAVFSPNIALTQSLNDIDLGVLGQESQAMLERTKADSLQRERAKVAYVTREQKVLLQNEDTVGNIVENGQETGIHIRMSQVALLGRAWQSRFVGTIMHNHGNLDLPPSPPDLTFLFKAGFTLSPSILVSTINTNYLIFRGEETPQWTDKILDKKMASWVEQLHDRVRMFQNTHMTDQDNIRLHHRATMAMVAQIARTYDLQLFTGNSSQNSVTKLKTGSA